MMLTPFLIEKVGRDKNTVVFAFTGKFIRSRGRR